jgi:peroxiredoxin
MKHIATLVTLLLLAATGAEARAPRVGEAVATFSLQDLSGKKVDTARFKGKTTILFFWNNLCGCSEQLLALKTFVAARQGRSLVFVAVNEGQGRAIAERLITANKLPYEALLDSDLEVGRNQFGVKVLPTIFIIDKLGTLREKLIGVVDTKKLESIIQRYL